VGVKSPVAGKAPGVVVGLALNVAEGVPVAEGWGVGVGVSVGLAEAPGIAVGLALGLGVAVGVNVGVGLAVLPEGVATKAGTSPACTIKFLVSVLVIPDASNQETVIECGPSESGVEGL
jgi:hypothetical protein